MPKMVSLPSKILKSDLNNDVVLERGKYVLCAHEQTGKRRWRRQLHVIQADGPLPIQAAV